ncbi:MAG TPA: DUF4440 domain-containing protein [Ottowia sp.]|nr:DUF4440 domain-containing protein [Ottowia sp.]HPR45510.1 DUF4440 domain-containing protein [Ottowia sp.]
MQAAVPTPAEAARALREREPVFHRPEHGTTRADFEAMTAPDFWEVGASGRVYSRAFVLDTLEARHAEPVQESFTLDDFACRELAPGLFLATYRLDMGGRRSRRATVWRWHAGAWRIDYHQGTLVSEE